jgi:hypothetical protein
MRQRGVPPTPEQLQLPHELGTPYEELRHPKLPFVAWSAQLGIHQPNLTEAARRKWTVSVPPNEGGAEPADEVERAYVAMEVARAAGIEAPVAAQHSVSSLPQSGSAEASAAEEEYKMEEEEGAEEYGEEYEELVRVERRSPALNARGSMRGRAAAAALSQQLGVRLPSPVSQGKLDETLAAFERELASAGGSIEKWAAGDETHGGREAGREEAEGGMKAGREGSGEDSEAAVRARARHRIDGAFERLDTEAGRAEVPRAAAAWAEEVEEYEYEEYEEEGVATRDSVQHRQREDAKGRESERERERQRLQQLEAEEAVAREQVRRMLARRAQPRGRGRGARSEAAHDEGGVEESDPEGDAKGHPPRRRR